MILSTHFIAGAALASKIDSPFLLLAYAVMLHFTLDMIPHWQYIHTSAELKNRKVQAWVAIDLIAGPLLISFLAGTADIYRLLWLWLGGIFCMLPDFLAVLALLFPKNIILEKINGFHELVQTYAHKRGFIGVMAQLTIIFLALWILI